MAAQPPDTPTGPPETIVCVDCGAPCHLLTAPREDGSWQVGDIVAYRCSGCADRWDLVLEPEDVDDGVDVTRGDDYPQR